MESVLTHQEDMVAELKELRRLRIFSEPEIKQIIVKRTTFEKALVNNDPRKSDYLRYIEYLMALEALRKKRVKRLKIKTNGASVADYCFTRAISYIYERALRRWKSDVALWIQAIEFAKKNRAFSVAAKLAASALQLHPHCVPLYVLSAAEQMRQNTPAAARTIFQRGLRINADKVHLWVEYVRMELQYIEARRIELQELRKMEAQLSTVEGTAKPNDVDGMQDVMNGAVVTAVLQNAAQALPIIELFQQLYRLLSTYPTPLRETLLDELTDLLRKTLPSDPEALKLAATWTLQSDWTLTEAFVARLQEANRSLLDAVKNADESKQEEMGVVYACWVEETSPKLEDVELRQYLTRSLRTLIATLPRSRLSPPMLLADLRLTKEYNNPKAQALGRKYVGLLPKSTALWLEYLELLRAKPEPERIAAWKEAKSKSQDTVEVLYPLWLWGLRLYDDDEALENAYQDILKSSMRHTCALLHSYLLLEYLQHLYRRNLPSSSRLSAIKTLLSRYMPSDACFRFAFSQEVYSDTANRTILEVLYDKWRMRNGSETEAALRFADWLLAEGDGKRAKEVVDRTWTLLDDDGRRFLEAQWSKILDSPREAEEEESEESSSGSEDDEGDDEELGAEAELSSDAENDGESPEAFRNADFISLAV